MSDIIARLQSDIHQSLKSGETERTEVLRLLLSAAKKRQIDSGQPLDELSFIAVVEKMIKQRHESMRYYEEAGRTDLLIKEREEIRLLEPFRPAPMDEDEVAAIIDAAFQETAAAAPSDMGKVMAIVKDRTDGRADMTTVSQIVRQRLTPAAAETPADE